MNPLYVNILTTTTNMRTAFKIPLQSEVSLYIETKKNWPKTFCDYYAEKFWNHYQASGWKLSNGNSIKDWKAAFNSQWQVPKYKEDIELLTKSMKTSETKSVANGTTDVNQLDRLLNKYKQHPTEVSFKEFGKWYDLLKSEKLLRQFSKQDIEDIRVTYNNDNEKCRCACVQMTFDSYANTNLTFGSIMEIRQRLK